MALSQSQPPDSQAVLRVDLRHDYFRGQFGEFLLETKPASWQAGWQLAEDTGVSVAPMLWDLWKSEGSQLERRLLLLCAHGLAAGTRADPALDGELGRLDNAQEKVMASLILACGPRRDHGMVGLGRLTDRSQEMAVRVAAYAALSRFRADIPPIRADRGDPGLVAAALYAGGRLPERELEPWFRSLESSRAPRTTPGPEHLVMRGYLLAGPEPDPDRNRRLDRAQYVYDNAMASHPEIRDARSAALLCLARLGDPEVILDRIGKPDPDLLLLLATVPEMRDAVPGSWFQPVPTTLVDSSARRRLAMLYVLKHPVETVLSHADAWTADAEIRSAMCLTLAWRLLGSDAIAGRVQVPATIRAIPEGAWVQWAAGGEGAAGQVSDPVLARAQPLAFAGRLPKPAARSVLEQALWRSGSHPSLARYAAHIALLRDLLLSGSNHVSAKLGGEAQDRYLPAGISRTDPVFFDIAYQYLQYVAVPRQIPETLRLR